MALSKTFKAKIMRSGLGMAGLACIFHVAAYRHMDKVNQPRNDALPDQVAVVTGAAGRVQLGLQKLAEGEIEGLRISGASSPLDSILVYYGYDITDAALQDKISLDDADNTEENARHIVQWARNNGLSHVGIITSSWHAHRLAHYLEEFAGGRVRFSFETAGEETPSLRTVYWEYGALMLHKADQFNTDFHLWLGTDKVIDWVKTLPHPAP